MATPSSSSSPSQSKSPIASDSGEFTVNINGAPIETSWLPSTSCLQLETQLGKSNINYNSTAVNPSWDAKNKVRRDSSYDFSNDAAIEAMGNLNEDFEEIVAAIGQISAREVPVSFKEGVRRRSNASGQQRTGAGEEVVAYTTTSSFGRNSGLLSTKMKSRLLHTPQLHKDERSQKMAMQSGQLGKGCEVEEDDPFLEDDLPKDYNKKIKFSSLTILQLVNALRERKALALSLNDTKNAVNKLHQMLNALVAVFVAVISLLILEVATTQFFIFFISQILLVAFMFGNTAKTIFEAIVFLFIMHPYDVSDRVEIDRVQMVVEEMNILTTVFLRYDNQKMTYPNSVLSTKLIGNFYRSPDIGDSIDFAIHISTTMEKIIATMKERITSYIENTRDHWYPAPLVVMRDIEDMKRIK